MASDALEVDAAALGRLQAAGFQALWPDDCCDAPISGDRLCPPSPQALAAHPTLRCLDGTHRLHCQTCQPAPTPDTAHAFSVLGDPGQKNGPAKLRALICRAEEWQSSAARETAAAALSAAGFAEAGEAVRDRRVARLKKLALFALLRHWNYKGDSWARARPEARAGSPPEPRSRPLALPLAPFSRLPLTAVHAALAQIVQPRVAFSHSQLAGLASAAGLVRSGPAAPLVLRLLVNEMDELGGSLANLWLPALAGQLGAMRGELAALSPYETVLPPATSGAAALLGFGIQQKRVGACKTGALVLPSPPGAALDMAEAWDTEMAASNAANLAVIVETEGLLHALADNSPREYGVAAVLLLENLQRHLEALQALYARRSAWAGGVLAAGVVEMEGCELVEEESLGKGTEELPLHT